MLTNEDIDSSEAYRRAQVAEKQLREVARRQAEKNKAKIASGEPEATLLYQTTAKKGDDSDFNQNSELGDGSRRLDSESSAPRAVKAVAAQKFTQS